MSSTVVLFFILYLVAMIGVGIWAAARRHTELDFDLAGRQHGTLITALSASASSESAFVLLGMVGIAYRTGVNCLWILLGGLLGYSLNWFVVGNRVRHLSQQADLRTLPQILAHGCPGGWHRLIRTVASLIALVFLLSYVSAQFNAAGKAFDSMFNIDYKWGVWLGLIIVLSYAARGGLRSVGLTDAIQAGMMVVVVLILPLAGLIKVGGPSGLRDALAAIDPSLAHGAAGATGWAGVGVVISWVALGLAYPGQPHVIDKFMSARDSKVFQTAPWIGIIWFQLVYLAAITLGLVARVEYSHIEAIAFDPENTLPVLATSLFPAVLGGLALAAIIAAMASTADSQLVAASTCVATDLLPRRQILGLSEVRIRVIILVLLGTVAGVFATTENRVIFKFVLYAWISLGAALGPAMLYVLHIRRRSPLAILGGIVTGLVGSIALDGSSYQLAGSFAASVLVIAVVHLLARLTNGVTSDDTI